MAASGSSHSAFGLSSSETSSSDEAPRQRGRPPASRAVASKSEFYIGSDSESEAGEVRDTGGGTGLDLERELETVIKSPSRGVAQEALVPIDSIRVESESDSFNQHRGEGSVTGGSLSVRLAQLGTRLGSRPPINESVPGTSDPPSGTVLEQVASTTDAEEGTEQLATVERLGSALEALGYDAGAWTTVLLGVLNQQELQGVLKSKRTLQDRIDIEVAGLLSSNQSTHGLDRRAENRAFLAHGRKAHLFLYLTQKQALLMRQGPCIPPKSRCRKAEKPQPLEADLKSKNNTQCR